eukprot:gene16498-34401_t
MSESKNRSILDIVQDFCTSTEFEGEFEAFAREHAGEFADSLNYTTKDEHPHGFHTVYQKYLQYFEKKIETFIKKEGYNAQEFYEDCRETLESKDCSGETRFFVEALLATSEYDMFFALMQAEMHQYRKESKAEGNSISHPIWYLSLEISSHPPYKWHEYDYVTVVQKRTIVWQDGRVVKAL